MQLLVFWLIYPLVWLISKLPFWLFYKISDAVYVLVYHIIGYRKKTVTENLKLVFPEKSSDEIKSIRKKFYQHMCDMFLEMVKSLSITNKQLKERFTFTNLDEIVRIRKLDKSIILMCGHYASYEWLNALQLYGLDYKGYGIYKKVKNKYFDKMAKDIRGRFDGELITTSKATLTITNNENEGKRGVYAMIADQSPKLSRSKYWSDFLGANVPVFFGSEKLAKNLDMAVVYLHVEKIKRGYYSATFIPISDFPKEEPEFKITRTYLNLLEEQIKKDPEYYLWTHKRWKHKDAVLPADVKVISRNS